MTTKAILARFIEELTDSEAQALLTHAVSRYFATPERPYRAARWARAFAEALLSERSEPRASRTTRCRPRRRKRV